MSTFQEIQNEQKEDDLYEFVVLEIIGEILIERESKKMSQRELSSISGVPQKTISRIENGIDIPKFKTLFKLLNALNLDINIQVTHKKNI